jgi:hypothetical protein
VRVYFPTRSLTGRDLDHLNGVLSQFCEHVLAEIRTISITPEMPSSRIQILGQESEMVHTVQIQVNENLETKHQ